MNDVQRFGAHVQAAEDLLNLRANRAARKFVEFDLDAQLIREMMEEAQVPEHAINIYMNDLSEAVEFTN